MAGWQEELAELLRELGVTQEEPQTKFRSTGKLMHSDVMRHLHPGMPHEHLPDAFPTSESDEEALWNGDLGIMRRKVDEIVQQFVELMRDGSLEQSLKEDVLLVLHALRRRAAVTQQAEAGEEASLEAVSAILHFCRLVLCLCETTIEGF